MDVIASDTDAVGDNMVVAVAVAANKAVAGVVAGF